MKEAVISKSNLLLGWLAVQVFFTLLFTFYLRSSNKNVVLDDQLPKTAVILCLRGANPFLPNCLQALFHQNYPNYDIKIVVDSQDDPAWNIVTEVVSKYRANNVQISPLKVQRYNCSLKCSSLIQAVSDLDDSYKVVAFIDADAVVHPDWLRELVSPLSHPKIGATTGNRWYLPTGRYWGSQLRYIWNVSAVIQMWLYRLPWGGSLAIKTDVIYQTGLLEKWGQAYSEDIMIHKVLAKHGMRVKFVPTLLILNSEECDLPRLFRSLKRQLLSSRLYHPWWLAVIADSISTVVYPNVILILSLTALWTKQWDAAVIGFAIFCSYMLALLLLVLIVEKRVQQTIRKYNQTTTKLSVTTLMKMLVAIPLTQWMYGFLMLNTVFMRRVNWRGVTYRINGPWDVRMLEYRPYRSGGLDDRISI